MTLKLVIVCVALAIVIIKPQAPRVVAKATAHAVRHPLATIERIPH